MDRNYRDLKMIELGDLINEFVHLTLVLFYFKDMVN